MTLLLDYIIIRLQYNEITLWGQILKLNYILDPTSNRVLSDYLFTDNATVEAPYT